MPEKSKQAFIEGKKLNFGCGNDIRESWDNVDIQKGPGLYKSFDFNSFPYPLKENTYNYIEARQILQCLNEPDKVLNELWRISKNGAIIKIITNYWNNKGAFTDIQTKHYFTEWSFKYFALEEPCRINKTKKFEILSLVKTPTVAGKLFPKFIREKIDLFMSGLYSTLVLELKVIKGEGKK